MFLRHSISSNEWVFPDKFGCNTNSFYSLFFGSFIKLDHIKRGRISCTISVKPQISNAYGTLHGGYVGSSVELLSIACARTVIADDKELFLGDINVSYLSSQLPHQMI